MKNIEKMEMLLDYVRVLKEDAGNLKFEVLDILVDHIECCENFKEVRGFIEDVRTYGCASGMIGELTYYSDTKKFFIDNLDEIQDYVNDLIQDQVYSAGEFDYNEIVWVVFEAIANEYFYFIEDEMNNIEAREEAEEEL